MSGIKQIESIQGGTRGNKQVECSATTTVEWLKGIPIRCQMAFLCFMIGLVVGKWGKESKCGSDWCGELQLTRKERTDSMHLRLIRGNPLVGPIERENQGKLF